MKKKSKLPQFSLVKFNFDNIPKKHHKHFKQFQNKYLIMLGEIEFMPGHCIVVDPDGKLHWAYHTEEFIKLKEDEV